MSHSTLQAKRATFTFCLGKSSLKLPKMVHFRGQIVLPDRSLFFIQKLLKNAKIQMRHFFKQFASQSGHENVVKWDFFKEFSSTVRNVGCDFLSDFQTLWTSRKVLISMVCEIDKKLSFYATRFALSATLSFQLDKSFQ